MNRLSALVFSIFITAIEFVTLFLLIQPVPARASALAAADADADLDPTFGNGGVVTTAIPGRVSRLIVQGDKIVAVGGLTVAHFNADGSLDASYGNGGVLTVSAPFSLSVAAVTVQPDSKVILAGHVPTGTVACGPGGCYPSSVGVVRLNADGAPDGGFGAGGLITRQVILKTTIPYTSATSGHSFAEAVGIRRDGQIMVADDAPSYLAYYAYSNLFVLSYNPDGTSDAEFGQDGLASAAGGSSASILFGDNDDVVLVSTTFPKQSPRSLHFDRIAKDGRSVRRGYVSSFQCPWAIARGGVVQADGRVIIGGSGSDSPYCTSLIARFAVSGSLDTSFGARGMITDALVSEAFAIQRDDKLLVAGTYSSTMTLVRYGWGGLPDTTFGNSGRVSIGISPSMGSAVAVQSDDKILVGGSYKGGDGREYILLTRFIGTPVAILKTHLPYVTR